NLNVENVGRGPALEVRGELAEFEKPTPGIAQPVGEILPEGSSMTLAWTGLGEAHKALSGVVIYGDISEWVYVSRFIAVPPEGARPDNWGGPARLLSFGFEEQEPFPFDKWWQRPLPPRLRRAVVRRRFDKRYGLKKSERNADRVEAEGSAGQPRIDDIERP